MTTPPPARAIAIPTSQARRSIAGMAGFILALNALGWGMLVFVVIPQHHTLNSSQVFGIGLGITAFTLGVGHAFDAEHMSRDIDLEDGATFPVRTGVTAMAT